MASKEEVRDLIPDLDSQGGYVVDKVEGLATTAEGEGVVSTDTTVWMIARARPFSGRSARSDRAKQDTHTDGAGGLVQITGCR